MCCVVYDDDGGGGSAQQPGGRRVQKADDTVFLRKPGILKKNVGIKNVVIKNVGVLLHPHALLQNDLNTHQYVSWRASKNGCQRLDVIDIFSQSASQSFTNVCFLDTFHVGYFIP